MSDYPVVSITNAPDELNRLHAEIEGKMRATVQDAIRAGEILAQVKGRLPHGDFLPWVKVNCRFSDQTARNYMGLFSHHDKIKTVLNLQEAYRQIESIEAKEKDTEAEKTKALIREYKTTGKKPEGWDRSTDYEARKQAKADEIQSRLDAAEAARTERVGKMQDDLRREHEQNTRRSPPPSIEKDEIDKLVAQVIDQAEKRSSFKESIRVSHEGKDDPFVDAIMDYLETLTDDNRRIEACYNIIKVCKGIANQLQKVTA